MDAMYYQFQTVSLAIKVKSSSSDKPLDGYKQIIVSLDQGGRGGYHGDYFFDAGSPYIDIENSVINLLLDQEESGYYAPVKTDVQVNILYDDASRNVTAEGRVRVKRNLYQEVMV